MWHRYLEQPVPLREPAFLLNILPFEPTATPSERVDPNRLHATRFRGMCGARGASADGGGCETLFCRLMEPVPEQFMLGLH